MKVPAKEVLDESIKPTEKQIKALIHFGFTENRARILTKKQCSEIIDALITEIELTEASDGYYGYCLELDYCGGGR